MISDLLTLLAQGGVDDPTPDELADVLWLAQRILPQGRVPEDTDVPVDTDPAAPAATAEDGPDHTVEDAAAQQDWVEVLAEEEVLDVHVSEPGREAEGRSGTPVQVPAAAALPHALALAKALKPLTRKVPSRTAFELDEEATVTRLVDEDLLLPVMRPEPRRWLSLALVVDCGPSMSLWQDEIHEIQHEVARLGAFRAVRRWNLLPSGDGTSVELRPHPAANRPARRPGEVVDPGGDQLILVLSDTVDAMWRTGAAERLLADWARHSQVALAHLLPAVLWKRVGIAPTAAELHIPQRGLPNAQWEVAPSQPARARRATRAATPVPVIELEPQPLKSWAEMTAGNGRWTRSTALLLSGAPRPARARRSAASPTPMTAEETVRRFRASSSPSAWRLAGLLSAQDSVTMPVARLVQRAMLREASRGDLAQVFLGGLLRRGAGPENGLAGGLLSFEFRPDVRNALLGAQFRSDVELVRDLVRSHVTAYLKPRYGSARSMPGAVPGAARPGGVVVPVEGEPIAAATREDVTRMGASPPTVEEREEPSAAFAGPSERVFISYAAQDRAWAEWVAWQLDEAGYSVELDVWHWQVGDSVVERIDAALARADMVVALFSPSYFDTERWTQEEAAAVLAALGRLIPLVVEPLRATDMPPLFTPILRRDLYGLDEPTAVAALLEAVGYRAELDNRTLAADGAPGLRSAPRLPGGRGPDVWNVPRRDPRFVGREELLIRLREDLNRLGAQAVHGMGGVGKSQVALEYAHRFADQYDIVWWVDAERVDHLPISYGELAERLGIAHRDAGAEVNARALLHRLGTIDRWLIILDNAEDPDALEPWLPRGSGHVLITSRNPNWRRLTRTTALDVFSRSDSRRYLTHEVLALTAAQAHALARDLGDLPLALAQAAGALKSGMPVDRYRTLLSEQSTQLLGQASALEYPTSVSASVGIAAAHLAGEHPEALALLRLSAYFGPARIPTGWLVESRSRLSSVPGDRDDLLWPASALRPLARYGLARVDSDAYQVHRLTQAVIRDQTSEAQAAAANRDVTAVLAAARPGDPDLPETWPAWAMLTAHLTERPRPDETDLFALHETLFDSVRYLLHSGRPHEALRMCVEFHDLWSRTLGEDHPDTVTWAAHLAQSTAETGSYADARQLSADVLERRRHILGYDHPDTLASAGNLANVLGGLGENSEARVLHQDVHVRRRTLLGEDHPDTLTSASNLANALNRLGEHAEAQRIHDDVLQRRRRVLGDDHPSTLDSTDNLADALRSLGWHSEARRMAEDALERRRRLLGEDHPDTVTSAANLARALSGLGERAEARQIQEDVLRRRRRAFGDDHPLTIVAAHDLAVTLQHLGALEESRALLEDARDRCRRVFGDDNPNTAAVTETLARVLSAMGLNYQAQKLLSASKGRRQGRRR